MAPFPGESVENAGAVALNNSWYVFGGQSSRRARDVLYLELIHRYKLPVQDTSSGYSPSEDAFRYGVDINHSEAKPDFNTKRRMTSLAK
jgi:hypothetical protein